MTAGTVRAINHRHVSKTRAVDGVEATAMETTTIVTNATAKIPTAAQNAAREAPLTQIANRPAWGVITTSMRRRLRNTGRHERTSLLSATGGDSGAQTLPPVRALYDSRSHRFGRFRCRQREGPAALAVRHRVLRALALRVGEVNVIAAAKARFCCWSLRSGWGWAASASGCY